MTHDLYVHLAGDPSGGSEQGWQARQRTLEILHYIDSRLGVFHEMRLFVRVHKVRGGDLRQSRLKAAMERRGISSLPALVTPNNTYLGVSAIGGVYEKNCRDFAEWKQKQPGGGPGRPPLPLRPEEDLASFYRREMGGGDGEDGDGDGDDDDAMGEGGDIMDSYRAMMTQRETGRGAPLSGGGRAVRGAAVPSRGAPRGADPSGRANNVGRAEGEGREEFSNLVSRMGGDIDSRTRTAAFAGGGGDEDGDDGAMGGNPAQDDLMEQAYWGNMEESLP